MNTFEQKINEDLRSALIRSGQKFLAISQPARTNARNRFWALLGDSKAAGELDLNNVLTALIADFHYFCGQMKYDQTIRAYLDFLQVLRGQTEIPTNDLMAMMKGTPNLNMTAPDQENIDRIFATILGNDYANPQDLVSDLEHLEETAKDRNNKGLIFEWMRKIIQINPHLLDQPEYAKLVPFVDRYLNDSELQKVMTNVATAMLRSKAIQDYKGNADDEGDPTKTSSDTPQKSGKNVPVEFPEKGSAETVGAINARLDVLHFTVGVRDRYLGENIDWAQAPSEIKNLAGSTEKINAITANIMLLMCRNMSSDAYIAETMKWIMDQTGLGIFPIDSVRALRMLAIRGGDVNNVIAQFNAVFNTPILASKAAALMVEAEAKLKRAKSSSEPEKDETQ